MALAATGLIVLLARPQATIAVALDPATVLIATDRSGSMLAEDLAPSRLVAAREAAGGFRDEVPDAGAVASIASFGRVL